MSINEKVNKEFLYVLDKIKEEEMKTVNGKPVRYWTTKVIIGGEGPSAADEGKILEKLEEMGAINISNPGGTPEYM